MDKRQKAFTLVEALIGVAVLGVLATLAAPPVSGLLDKHALKVNVTRLQTHVDKARVLASSTECPVDMNISQLRDKVEIRVTVRESAFMRGCAAWFSQTSGNNSHAFTAALENVRLMNNANLRFNAVSGALDSSSQPRLVLHYGKAQADINYQGIATGVVAYRVNSNE